MRIHLERGASAPHITRHHRPIAGRALPGAPRRADGPLRVGARGFAVRGHRGVFRRPATASATTRRGRTGPAPSTSSGCPARTTPGSVLLFRPGQDAALVLNLPRDYWHSVPEAADRRLDGAFRDRDRGGCLDARAPRPARRPLGLRAARRTRRHGGRVGLRGDESRRAGHALEFARLYKTAYEVECIAAANRRAARGHLAARARFSAAPASSPSTWPTSRRPATARRSCRTPTSSPSTSMARRCTTAASTAARSAACAAS
jgi:hypothetical protein